MSKNLVIVESPAKASTISNYLGKDFIVKSSFGHVRDLQKKGMSIEIDNGFKPNYEVTPDKKQIVAELKKLAKSAEIVWLATDEDREGEAISWHLLEALGLKVEKTKRITFNEITKPAIQKAITKPREIDINLVNAQQARRVLDRLVGFELSPILWRKVKPSLSAGRVQSVTVRLIVEREREINGFTSTSAYRVIAIFDLDNGVQLKAELPKRIKEIKDAEEFLTACGSADFSISNIQTKPAKKSPAAPFTTSTLQQEASRKLGFSVAQTMTVAQRLYEAGKITYMRTDSVNLSDTALTGAQQAIINSYGDKYHKTRKYKSKAKGAQEAHEAIRPTDFTASEVEGERNEMRLYELIWKRSIASQMSDAELEKTSVTIDVSNRDEKLQASGEVLKFDGFLKVYLEGTDDEEEEQKGMLPPLTVNQSLRLNNMQATERFTHHAARFTEAALVRKLEELGIGRPSTYAPTISTVQKRGYVVKEDREGHERKYNSLTVENGELTKEIKIENTGAEKSKLFPTDIGIVVNDFLVQHFTQIMDYNFTAQVEAKFDEIADGGVAWNEMIGEFYQPFHARVEDTMENSERASGERELGIDPTTNKKVIARIGRFGPMVQLGDAEDEDKRFSSLRAEQSITSITLEEALDLFKLPRALGEFNEKAVSAAVGRFGPYVKYGSVFVSIKKDSGLTPYSITLEEAQVLILEKQKADAEKMIKVFEERPEVQILNGRWGPYIKFGKRNLKIGKDVDPKSLTIEDCDRIAKETPDKPKRKKS
ncbi:MAG: DNA topoisomerase-1 [Flavobacteriales bacterium]|jgi:DNA topoisomerase-1